MNTATGMLRLVIADDHPVTRQGLAYTFSLIKDFDLVCSASNGDELLAAVTRYRPDVVITDLKMPGMDGSEACARLRQSFSGIGIIVFSNYDSEDMILQLRTAGVRGYLLKGADGSEIVKAVRAIHAGGEYYCKTIRERINGLFQTGKLGRETPNKKQLFTDVELQVIRLFYEGFTAKGVAVTLKIKVRTVQTHKENIEEKMNVKGEIAIVVYALKNWLLY